MWKHRRVLGAGSARWLPFKPLAMGVAFALAISFLLSRTFVPMMCARFLNSFEAVALVKDIRGV
jgi:multidrug efflux pump subunit AcrB